ncbi:MAG: hypothetical protein US40_C0013G0011 [Candidatus Roizmanbacteria bacterium GW2011_GWC2_37_13]|uniref:Uncharacterized protein n=1 Tax=Candidatus Roizmanbacteria bacterium GW2011_GWC2_37_13 TaxID=1618486 RepID=A0A0G0IKX8_9BACT|nr:MAG: hypothetical protein US38_C0014G0013 [Candidatus Roizmanbacteria bacterium GW2011_GWC1_37_12]KKQ24879.1 MAG: hypothetical protein US40_C0013G0011 [Candidatus Roizmanbacteria bacterium GW2011_GWC2_37_13]
MNKVSSIKYLVFSIRAMVFVLILYTLYSILNTNIFAQTSSPEVNFSDREYDQTWSCVHVEQNGQVQFGEGQGDEIDPRKIPKSPIKMSGVCNDSESCEVVICALPTGGGRREGEGSTREPCLSVGMGGAGVNGERPQEEIPEYCYDKCWKNKDTNISPELKQFFAGAVSAQAGPGNNINTDNVLLYMPYVTFDGNQEQNSFPAGSFTDIPGVLHNAHGHAIYMIYSAPINGIAPTITMLSPLPTQKSGDDASQKLSSLNFGQTQVQISEGNPQMCSIILWDPYGKVFDSQSLEPLGEDDAIVTLLDKNDNRVSLPTNDDSLDIFGVYNILVIKDDSYKLKVAPKTNHSFESVDVNPLYKDLYEFIYKAGDPPFFEKASDPKRVDIPLKPIGAPFSRPIEIGKMTQKDISAGTQFIIKVTHPLSKVKVISNGKVLMDGETDKSGIFQAVIKKSLLSQYGYSIEISKNTKYFKTGIVTKTVSADLNKIRIEDEVPDDSIVIADFNPLLTYIEGFAYDRGQKIIPEAKISVVLKMDKSVYYQTSADDSGFFTIYSKDLPFLDYYLMIENPETKEKFSQTTSQFVKNNETYLKSENLDLMEASKNSQPIVNPQTGELNKRTFNDNLSNDSSQKLTNQVKTNMNLKVFLIVFILIILVFAVLGIVLYIKKS